MSKEEPKLDTRLRYKVRHPRRSTEKISEGGHVSQYSCYLEPNTAVVKIEGEAYEIDGESPTESKLTESPICECMSQPLFGSERVELHRALKCCEKMGRMDLPFKVGGTGDANWTGVSCGAHCESLSLSASQSFFVGERMGSECSK